MPLPRSKESSTSGIIESASGEKHIPSSQRADGSTRREIKIRPGYRPPEDVEVYKNRTAEAWKNRGGGGGGVPGATLVESDDGRPAAGGGSTAASTKNAKRKEARRRAKAAAENKDDGGAEPGWSNNAGTTVAGQRSEGRDEPAAAADSQTLPRANSASDDPAQERERQARRLQKKLRQARDLKEKKDKGDTLLPEQLEKVIRMNELVRQLESLGFDSEGQRQGADE